MMRGLRIKERIDLQGAAFAGLKRDLAAKNSGGRRGK